MSFRVETLQIRDKHSGDKRLQLCKQKNESLSGETNIPECLNVNNL